MEIASHGDGSIRIRSEFMDALTDLRLVLGHSIVLSSAYRDPVHNARIGGEPLSRHKICDAGDLQHIRMKVDQDYLVEQARGVGFSGIGLYDTFTHLDLGPTRIWDYRSAHA